MDQIGTLPIVTGQSGVFYVNLPSQSSPVGPTLGPSAEPFDLTGMTAMTVNFPGGVQESYAAGTVTVQGAAGSGKIKVKYSPLDSLNMNLNPNPEQFQDLTVSVTLSGVDQIDTLSIGGSISAGDVFTCALNGNSASYTAIAGDTSTTVFNALLTQLALFGLPVSLNVTGGTLVVTSSTPAMPFSDVVSSNVTKTPTQANGGTIAQWVFQNVLNIYNLQ